LRPRFLLFLGLIARFARTLFIFPIPVSLYPIRNCFYLIPLSYDMPPKRNPPPPLVPEDIHPELLSPFFFPSAPHQETGDGFPFRLLFQPSPARLLLNSTRCIDVDFFYAYQLAGANPFACHFLSCSNCKGQMYSSGTTTSFLGSFPCFLTSDDLF